MMLRKKILIIGASGHAKVIIDIIEQHDHYEIFGLIDTYKPIGTELGGYKILGNEYDILELMNSHDIYGGIIAVGDNWKRLALHQAITKQTKKFNFITAIHPKASIGKGVSVANGTVIMAGSVINCDAKVGAFCILNSISSLGHDSIMEDFSSLAPGVNVGGNAKIGYASAISMGANIIENIEIGIHTVVGAGATVIENVGDYKVVCGVPAKEIRQRNAGDKYLKGS